MINSSIASLNKMSDSEDDSSFVEVVYQSSSDSEWERIDSDREEEEQLDVVSELIVKELPPSENGSVYPPWPVLTATTITPIPIHTFIRISRLSISSRYLFYSN